MRETATNPTTRQMASLALATPLSWQAPAFAHGTEADSADDVHELIAKVRRATAAFHDAWDAAHPHPQPPVLFGHPFHLVRSPSRYGVPSFYESHLWAWEHNRNGIFNDWNPKVRCP